MRVLFAALPALPAVLASAGETTVRPDVDLSPLPALGREWRPSNPYRGLPAAIEIGRTAFNQSCARCHGANAVPAGSPAPDLRQLDRTCRRIASEELKARCQADNDAYFGKSVREGKLIVGITHMPPWKDVLSQEAVWAIQAFIEAQAGNEAKK